MYIQNVRNFRSNFWLSVLISNIPPYLMFILVSKFTHPVSFVMIVMIVVTKIGIDVKLEVCILSVQGFVLSY